MLAVADAAGVSLGGFLCASWERAEVQAKRRGFLRIAKGARPRLALAFRQLLDRLAAQLVQQRAGHKGVALNVQFQIGQLVGRVAQPAQLIPHKLGCQCTVLCRAKRVVRDHGGVCLRLLDQPPLGHQRRALVSGHAHGQRLFVRSACWLR